MVIVSQLDRDGAMRGLITTLNKQKAQLVPVSAPIIYLRRESFEAHTFGEFTEGQPLHGEYRRLLHEATDQGYARLVV